jgi:hypothetical protein
MPKKDRDYDELAGFQKAGMSFGEHVCDAARQIDQAAAAADGVLQDDVARRSISKVRELAAKLSALGGTIESDMDAHYQKTIRERDEFQLLEGSK